jgi:hypothetical protein
MVNKYKDAQIDSAEVLALAGYWNFPLRQQLSWTDVNDLQE